MIELEASIIIILHPKAPKVRTCKMECGIIVGGWIRMLRVTVPWVSSMVQDDVIIQACPLLPTSRRLFPSASKPTSKKACIVNW